MKKTLVVLTGAGISAESGVATFRDSDGLWENYSIEDVATLTGWEKNATLVQDFYNLRRQQMPTVVPNEGHKITTTYCILVIPRLHFDFFNGCDRRSYETYRIRLVNH